MPEDDAMDLNDEGVRLAALTMYRNWCGDARADWANEAQAGAWVDNASATIAAYLRAVPESDELVRLRAALKSIVDRHPDSPLGEHPAVDIARAALFPVACDE